MAIKKTLYEILEVSPAASFDEIQAAHQAVTKKLEQHRDQDPDGLKLKLVNMAFETLRHDWSRAAYDGQLNSRTAVAVTPKLPDANILALKAEAVALKADAASLMAEAAMIKADAMSLQAGSTQK
ncbi:MAG: DnaJ domain-containing protein, partial [Burkholderiales bacterium]